VNKDTQSSVGFHHYQDGPKRYALGCNRGSRLHRLNMLVQSGI